MSRGKVNKSITEPMGKRLEELVTVHLGLKWVDFSKQLGYKNSSTLHKVRSGVASISAEKLHEIAKLKLAKGRINLNWLVTGEGDPFLDGLNKPENDIMTNIKEAAYDEVALVSALINILQRSNRTSAMK